MGQGEKSVEVRQLKEEIAKLCSSLTNFVSRQVEGGVRKHKWGRADGGDTWPFMCVCMSLPSMSLPRGYHSVCMSPPCSLRVYITSVRSPLRCDVPLGWCPFRSMFLCLVVPSCIFCLHIYVSPCVRPSFCMFLPVCIFFHVYVPPCVPFECLSLRVYVPT